MAWNPGRRQKDIRGVTMLTKRTSVGKRLVASMVKTSRLKVRVSAQATLKQLAINILNLIGQGISSSIPSRL